MMTLDELVSFLNSSKAEFEIIEHSEPILTVKDADQYFEPDKAVPVFIMHTNEGFFAFIVSGKTLKNRKLDFVKWGKKLGFHKFKLASEDDILYHTGYEAGSVPLIGHNLPIILDNNILDLPFIYGGTGNKYATLKIYPPDLLRLSKQVLVVDMQND